MRDAFAKELTACAALDPRIVLLSGDIGNRMFDDFKQLAPGRFFNCGVAEANMTGVAAGMALMGLRPVTYTITPFATLRCLEQIRIDLCYHNLPAIVAGTGSGLSYAELGPTHHSLEDVGMLRLLPNLSILVPCDPEETRLALRAALEQDGPVYLRLGKKGEPRLHAQAPDLVIGKSINLRRGTDLCIIGCGPILAEALAAADLLQQRGISARVEDMHTIKPLDTERLEEIFENYPLVATLEEHFVAGGLGGSVAEWLSERPRKARLVRLGLPDQFVEEMGSQDSVRRQYGLDGVHLAGRLERLLS